jgi:hypothetical protein
LDDLPAEKRNALDQRAERERLARKHIIDGLFDVLRRDGDIFERHAAIAAAKKVYGEHVVKDALCDYDAPLMGAIGGLMMQREYLTDKHIGELLRSDAAKQIHYQRAAWEEQRHAAASIRAGRPIWQSSESLYRPRADGCRARFSRRTARCKVDAATAALSGVLKGAWPRTASASSAISSLPPSAAKTAAQRSLSLTVGFGQSMGGRLRPATGSVVSLAIDDDMQKCGR